MEKLRRLWITIQVIYHAGNRWDLSNAGWFLGALLLVATIGFSLDPWCNDLFKGTENGPFESLAQKFSYWGDFPTGTLLLVATIAIFGVIQKNPTLQRAALACLLASVIAGLIVNTVRLTAGRPRPNATLASATARLGNAPRPWVSFHRYLPDGRMLDGMYGPQRPAMFQGFPSGHSATSIATATALVIVAPPLGWALLPCALGVCWSRLYLHAHQLSDVLVGGSIGLLLGLIFGALFGEAAKQSG